LPDAGLVEVPRKLLVRLRLGRSSFVALIAALTLAIAGYVLARNEVRDREQQLLRERAGQAATVMSSFARQIEAILYTGSIVADVTGGDPENFERRMGARLENTAISSITLLSLGGGRALPIASAGAEPLLVSGFDDRDRARLAEIAGSDRLEVVKIEDLGLGRVVGFAASGGQDGTLAVYAESVVPALDNRFLFRLPEGSDYALYLGPSQSPETLLTGSTDEIPIEGRTASETVKLGSEDGLLVVGAAGGIVGGLLGAAPWLTVVIGCLLAVATALAIEFLRRRRAVEAAARALAGQNERLREVDRLKDELVAVVSHELRTPLTSVIGYVELLREDADELTDEHRGFIDVIERNARRLLNLVGDLLFVARVDAGGLRLHFDEVDLAAVVAECFEAQRPRAAGAGVELALAIGPVPPIAGDRERLEQLVDNLVSNAIKFTPAGGRVDVRVTSSVSGVVIEVADTGMGIPQAERDRVFERFFRSSTAAAGAVQGTGLGLTIVKAIIDAHDGTIGFTSEEGGGTTFRIELPTAAQAPPRSSETAALVG
jgi:signal transduction histidine kinase